MSQHENQKSEEVGHGEARPVQCKSGNGINTSEVLNANHATHLDIALRPKTLCHLEDLAKSSGRQSVEKVVENLVERFVQQQRAQNSAAKKNGKAQSDESIWRFLEFTSPFLIAARNEEFIAAVSDWVEDRRCRTHVVKNMACAIQEAYVERFSCAVFDIDSFGDVAITIDQIVAFRSEKPNLPVILATNLIKRDDFGCERLPLCDVTLRKPLYREGFSFGLQEAIINNRIWIARRRELQLQRTLTVELPKWAAEPDHNDERQSS
jgi:hypothetical protein